MPLATSKGNTKHSQDLTKTSCSPVALRTPVLHINKWDVYSLSNYKLPAGIQYLYQKKYLPIGGVVDGVRVETVAPGWVNPDEFPQYIWLKVGVAFKEELFMTSEIKKEMVGLLPKHRWLWHSLLWVPGSQSRPAQKHILPPEPLQNSVVMCFHNVEKLIFLQTSAK